MIRVLTSQDEIDAYMKASGLNPTKPKATEPKATKPKVTKPKATKPKPKPTFDPKTTHNERDNPVSQLPPSRVRVRDREQRIYQLEAQLLEKESALNEIASQLLVSQLILESNEELYNAPQLNRRPVLKLCRRTAREISIAKTASQNDCCPICQETEPTRVSFNCGHECCVPCTTRYISSKKKIDCVSCPLCRADITTIQMQYTKTDGGQLDVVTSALGETLFKACGFLEY